MPQRRRSIVISTRCVERGLSMWVAVRRSRNRRRIGRLARSALRELVTRYRGRIAILEVRFDREPDAFSRFALQIAATEARAGGGDDAGGGRRGRRPPRSSGWRRA